MDDMTATVSVEGTENDSGDGSRLVILLNQDLRMSRGKGAAQAVHAALIALGVHPGCPVVVLRGTAREIRGCKVQIRDAGWTELEPGTLTAGVREVPASAPKVETVTVGPAELLGLLALPGHDGTGRKSTSDDSPDVPGSLALSRWLDWEPGAGDHVPTVRRDRRGRFVAVCSCGGYESKACDTTHPALYSALSHVGAKERAAAASDALASGERAEGGDD